MCVRRMYVVCKENVCVCKGMYVGVKGECMCV